jgi:hypothetical protein
MNRFVNIVQWRPAEMVGLLYSRAGSLLYYRLAEGSNAKTVRCSLSFWQILDNGVLEDVNTRLSIAGYREDIARSGVSRDGRSTGRLHGCGRLHGYDSVRYPTRSHQCTHGRPGPTRPAPCALWRPSCLTTRATRVHRVGPNRRAYSAEMEASTSMLSCECVPLHYSCTATSCCSRIGHGHSSQILVDCTLLFVGCFMTQRSVCLRLKHSHIGSGQFLAANMILLQNGSDNRDKTKLYGDETKRQSRTALTSARFVQITELQGGVADLGVPPLQAARVSMSQASQAPPTKCNMTRTNSWMLSRRQRTPCWRRVPTRSESTL